MNLFTNPKDIFKNYRIVIFGSYHPNNKPVLDRLVNYLKQRGFQQSKLAIDLIKIPDKLEDVAYEAYILSEIEKIMHEVDYNLFIFFPNDNNSTLIELTSLIKSLEFPTLRERTLVIINRNYNVSMLKGLLEKDKVYTFFYDNEIEICQKSYVFIKQNIFM